MNNKSTIRWRYAALLVLLLLQIGVKAQTLVPNYGTPTTPVQVANGAVEFKIRINGGTALCAPASALSITMPPGYVYVSNSAFVSAGSGIATQTSVSGNTATLSVTNIPASPDSTVITYRAYAGCGVIGGSNTTVTYNLTSCAGPAQATASVNAQNAQLNITNVTNPAFVGVIGQTYTRAITISNNGFGIIDTIYLDSKNQLGLTITGTTGNTGTLSVTKTWTGTDTTYRYRVVAPTADGHLSNGESVVLTETVKILSCLGATSDLKAWFGPNGTECSVISNSYAAGATINTSVQPNIVTSIIEQQELKCLPTTAATGWYTFQAKNTSTATALFTNLRNLHSNSNYHNAQGPIGAAAGFGDNCSSRSLYIDTAAGVQYSMNGGVTWLNLSYSVFQYWDNASINAGKPMALQFAGGIPQLAGGDSVRIRFKVHEDIPNCCVSNWDQAYLLFGGDFTDVCGNNAQVMPGVGSNTYNLNRYSFINNSPADAVAGQPYYITFKGMINSPNNTYRTSPDGYIDYEFTLPTSLAPSLAPADHSLVKGTTILVPDNVSWDAVTRKLRVRFLRSTIGVSQDYDEWTLKIKTTPDCNGTGGTVTANAYVKLAACAATEWQMACNQTASFTVHGCGACPGGGPINYATTARRTNYGIFSAANNGLPSGTIDTSLLNLQNTLYGDTVAVTTVSRITGTNSFSNMYVSITKSEANASHTFVDATAYIYNASTGVLNNTITGITAGDVTGTNPSTRTVSLTSGTGAPTSFAPGDSIIMVTRFRQLINAQRAVNFATTMYASNSPLSTGTPQFNCDGNWTGTVENLTVTTIIGGVPTWVFQGCGTGNPNALVQYVVGLNGINRHTYFPNEIRKVYSFDTLVAQVPQGFEITSMKIFVTGQGTTAQTGIVNYPVLSFNAATNTYYYDLTTLSNQLVAAGVPFSEGLWFNIQPTYKIKCFSANFEAYTATYTIKGINNTNGQPMNQNMVTWLASNNNTMTPLAVSSSSPNITVNSSVATWEVQVTNATTVTRSNVWMAEATSVNTTTINTIQELTGPGGTVVSTTNAVGGIFQLGAIPAATSKYYRVNASFTNCVMDSTKLVVDFNCDAYPATVSAGETGCRAKFLPLTVTAQTAALQLAKIAEPVGNQNLCDILTYELEVTNSGLGSATELAVRVQLPFTGGIEYVPGTYGYKYPATATSYTPLADVNAVVTGNTMTFNIPASAMASLPGTEKYRIFFQMKTLPCSFSSGEKLVFRPVGKNACNTNILGTSVAGNRINIIGVPPLLPQFTITSSVDSVAACGNGAVTTNYKFKIVNTGSLITSVADGFRITLPAPWTMNTAVTYSHNVSGATYSVSPAANVYDFKTGTGLAIGDSIVFTTTLNAASAAALTCGASNPIVESGFVEFATFCANPETNCNTKQLLEPEHTSTSIFVKRPSYTISAFTASASGTPPNHLVGSITVVNGNTTYVAQNATLKVYHDVNQNGVQDAGDSLIGNQVFALANQASQSFNYDITSSVAGNVCPLVAVMEIACNCSPASFSLLCTSIVLPIKFTKEEVKANGCAVDLTWAYEATGTRVTGFHIERSETTGNKWETMATVPAHIGNYTDNVPHEGKWLYRIQALNTDNEIAYSRVLSVNTDCKTTAVNIYPNPAREQVNIVLQGYGAADVNYNIMDKLGRSVQQGTLKGNTSNTIGLNKLAPGMYHVHIQYGGNNFVQKIDVLK